MTSLTPHRDAAERAIAEGRARFRRPGREPADLASDAIGDAACESMIRAYADALDSGALSELDAGAALVAAAASCVLTVIGTLAEPSPAAVDALMPIIVNQVRRRVAGKMRFSSAQVDATPAGRA